MTDQKPTQNAQQPAPTAKPSSPVAAMVASSDKRVATIRDILVKTQAEFVKALPKYIDAAQFLRVAITELRKSDKLMECDPRSFVGAIMQAAQLGLPVDSTLGQAYLVPYKGEVKLIPGYKGLIRLAFNTGFISSIGARVVREDDLFKVSEGTKPYIRHEPALITKVGKNELDGVIGAYARATMKDGGTQFVFMSRAQIEQRAKRSQAYLKQYGPWVSDPLAMFMKTPTRDLCKWLPASTSLVVEALARAVALDERAEAGISQDLESLVPISSFSEDRSKLDLLADAMPDDALDTMGD